MPVAVVQVGGVRVSVGQWFMYVFVRMCLGDQHVMLVLVMLVMHVEMFMQHRLVRMQMSVLFTHQNQHPNNHEYHPRQF